MATRPAIPADTPNPQTLVWVDFDNPNTRNPARGIRLVKNDGSMPSQYGDGDYYRLTDDDQRALISAAQPAMDAALIDEAFGRLDYARRKRGGRELTLAEQARWAAARTAIYTTSWAILTGHTAR